MVTFKTSLRYGSFLIKLLSFSQPSSQVSHLQEAVNFAYFLLIILIQGSMFIQVTIFIIQNSTGLIFITEHIAVQILFLQCTINLIVYRYNRKKVIKLIRVVNDVLQNGSLELKRQLGEYGRMIHIAYLVYLIFSSYLVIDTCLEALLKGDKDLPVPTWYPFNHKESSFLYSVACFHQIIALIYTTFGMGLDVTFGVLVYSCCVRFRVLQKMLREVTKSNDSKPQRRLAAGTGIDLDERISKLVDLHCELLDTVTDINDIYTYILFVLFLTSVIMICGAGFQITNGDKQSVNLFAVSVFKVSSVVLQLLFYYLPADKLGEEVFAVQTAAYDSGWESMPTKYKKQILMVMLRSANSPTLSSARVMPVTLEYYGSFMATTFSYFTSLRAVAGVS